MTCAYEHVRACRYAFACMRSCTCWQQMGECVYVYVLVYVLV